MNGICTRHLLGLCMRQDITYNMTWRSNFTPDQTVAMSGLISFTFPTFIRRNHFLHHHRTGDNCHRPLIADDDLTNNVVAW